MARGVSFWITAAAEAAEAHASFLDPRPISIEIPVTEGSSQWYSSSERPTRIIAEPGSISTPLPQLRLVAFQQASRGYRGLASLSSISCSQSSFTGAGTDACTVVLTGAAPYSGLTVSLSSNNSAVSVPASVSVPAGATSAGFTATVSAVSTAQTAIVSASAGSIVETCTISLDSASPALTISTTSVTFGSVDLNTPTTQSVTLTSSGGAALIISSGSVSGSEFTISGISFPATLNPGQTATLNLQFDPTTAGAATGAVTLTSNASPSTATITVSGTGVAGSYQVDLAWNAPTSSTDPVAGYNVYRATGSSTSYELLNATPTTSTAYTDSTVQNDASYTYYVESVDAEGNQSAPSNTYTASVP